MVSASKLISILYPVTFHKGLTIVTASDLADTVLRANAIELCNSNAYLWGKSDITIDNKVAIVHSTEAAATSVPVRFLVVDSVVTDLKITPITDKHEWAYKIARFCELNDIDYDRRGIHRLFNIHTDLKDLVWWIQRLKSTDLGVTDRGLAGIQNAIMKGDGSRYGRV